MQARDLTADDWQGGRDLGTVMYEPSADLIETAIRGLDGQRRTLVTISVDLDPDLDPDLGHYIAIGGGNGGMYVVGVTDQAGNNFDLLASEPLAHPDEPIHLVSGGQAVTYPREECVDLETALKAAKSFAETGELNPTLTWRCP